MGWWIVDLDGTRYEIFANKKSDAVFSAMRKHEYRDGENYGVKFEEERWPSLIGVERIPEPPKKLKKNPRNWLLKSNDPTPARIS